ncbi:MAG: Stp1/IreP family PP2C-type Ser/Thr phosphatase [Thermoleophilaceae bacterium]|nr:Stp1/IreP family PP2C-type Ser/Thr phosphatase [Thermoleophilaceae bacterium]
MALRIVEEAGLTDVGRQRHANEDAYYDSPPIFAVADGMGGARAGEVASRIAVEAFEQARDESAAPEDQLAQIARAANRRIYELAQEDEERAGMGTTLTAIMLAGDEIAIGHVGDSRAYRLRGDQLERLTQDHSLVEELVRQGKLTSEQAEMHPQRSIITRALGPEPEVDVETLTYPARAGDVYLLCSDGLTGMVPEERVAEILRARSSLRQAAEALVAEANERGGRDNITVVLFRLGSDDGADPGADAHVLQDTAMLGAAPSATPAGPEPRARRRTGRAVVGGAVALAAVAAVLAGLWIGSRQFWFVGADQGRVSLYRGLPYELPLGIKLYSEEYRSSVPSLSLPGLQRRRVLDHQLRGRSDAVDLVRSLERAYAS